jgi:hypothetical protein
MRRYRRRWTETRRADCPRCGCEDGVRQTADVDDGNVWGAPDMWEPPDVLEGDWGACTQCRAGDWTREEEQTLITTAGPWSEDDSDE